MDSKQYDRSYEEGVLVPAGVQDVFDYVDDHFKYYSHVIKFARIVGGRMALQADDGGGRSVGSHIRLSGSVLGAALSLEEVVTRREPPRIKEWETVGVPKFLIVGQYRYRVDIEPQDGGSLLKVSFDFSPPGSAGRVRLFLSRRYARTCAREMARITRDHFKKREH